MIQMGFWTEMTRIVQRFRVIEPSRFQPLPPGGHQQLRHLHVLHSPRRHSHSWEVQLAVVGLSLLWETPPQRHFRSWRLRQKMAPHLPVLSICVSLPRFQPVK